jgi:hypothetical protein
MLKKNARDQSIPWKAWSWEIISISGKLGARDAQGPKENVHGLLESLFVGYAKNLRAGYPDLKIRNGAVLTSAIWAFAPLGYIELVDRRLGTRGHTGRPHSGHQAREASADLDSRP